MVGIRDLNTAVSYPFRYPRWVPGMFYPAGSIVGYPKSGGDSDMVYYDFFVATRNVLPTETIIPSLEPKWEFFVSTSGGSPDSDLKLKVYMMDSDLGYVMTDYLYQDNLIRADHDSDMNALQSFIDGSVVKTVNGSSPDINGNVEVSLVSVNTGPNDQRRAFSADAVEGDFWVVSGDSEIANDGKSYIFDSDSLSWKRVNTADVAANDIRYVNKIGDTMQGPLTLDSDPILPLHAVTKNYVDNKDSDIYAFIAKHYRDSDLHVSTIYFGDNVNSFMNWNYDEQTLNVQLNNDVTLQIGQEQVFYGKATEAITNGDVVMFAGAQGSHLLFSKADTTSPNFIDQYIIGVATQDIANNDFGFVTVQGKVRGLDTSSYSEGALLYLDVTTPGTLTTTKPVSPDHAILIAAVTRSHATQGEIFVRPTFSEHISELHDVDTTGVTHGQVLAWDSDLNVWKPTTPSVTSIDSDSEVIAYLKNLLDVQVTPDSEIVNVYVTGKELTVTGNSFPEFNGTYTRTNWPVMVEMTGANQYFLRTSGSISLGGNPIHGEIYRNDSDPSLVISVVVSTAVNNFGYKFFRNFTSYFTNSVINAADFENGFDYSDFGASVAVGAIDAAAGGGSAIDSDITTTTVTVVPGLNDRDILSYDISLGKWVNVSIESLNITTSIDSDYINTQIQAAGQEIDGGGASTVFTSSNTVINGGGA